MNAYAFFCIDGVVTLSPRDAEKWAWTFSGLNLDETLKTLATQSFKKPWMKKRTWFHQLSGLLAQIEKGAPIMAFEQKDNTGSLFRNEKKEKENQPDYTGSALVDGTPKRLAAWLKTAKSGKKYMSISIKDDEERPKPINSAEDGGYTPATPPANGFDDIPF